MFFTYLNLDRNAYLNIKGDRRMRNSPFRNSYLLPFVLYKNVAPG
ncbi:protein of unknown function [Xenorhabdus doucetiae]|uniref:Uncharacterized protein n=1 Tax=Xenorhabdus doucetiae TaxID=351671 RepID=A0A068QSH5_9GAMM|nr:protein of unknown function [Xenorhabdus doucetiae]